MIGLSLGPSVMMQLGAFQFSISTAAYQELTRRSEYRWASQDRFGKQPNLQYTGPASEAISLVGVIYPDYKGGGQLDKMRQLAGGGQPLNLVGGAGQMMGRWVIESLEEKQGTFAAAGAPRKQEFTIALKRFPDSATNQIDALGKLATGTTASSGLGSFADGAIATVGSAISSMTSALDAVQAKAAEIGNAVGPVIATVQNSIRTARDLQSQVSNLKEASKNLNSLENVQSAIYGVMSAASAASNAGAVASGAATLLSSTMTTTDPGVITAVRSCTSSCSRSAVESTRVHAETSNFNQTLGA
ncbi:phage tail protein [Aeromonas veronii]|uniref:phage tail protein n=1 Tax=Aeromonas veronii TaxID=654 RepID=UPI00191D316E|nr:phage tail protein [Aeromonas veronii]MBL0492682.1 phage tail protein [Aeromonas veronii]